MFSVALFVFTVAAAVNAQTNGTLGPLGNTSFTSESAFDNFTISAIRSSTEPGVIFSPTDSAVIIPSTGFPNATFISTSAPSTSRISTTASSIGSIEPSTSTTVDTLIPTQSSTPTTSASSLNSTTTSEPSSTSLDQTSIAGMVVGLLFGGRIILLPSIAGIGILIYLYTTRDVGGKPMNRMFDPNWTMMGV